MATTKKPAVKKTATKASTARKTPVKKAATSKTVTKKPAAKRATTSSARKTSVKKAPKMRSFHVAVDQPPFKSFAITRQTVYWLILVCVIIFAQLWILKTQYDVISLLDQQLVDAAL